MNNLPMYKDLMYINKMIYQIKSLKNVLVFHLHLI